MRQRKRRAGSSPPKSPRPSSRSPRSTQRKASEHPTRESEQAKQREDEERRIRTDEEHEELLSAIDYSRRTRDTHRVSVMEHEEIDIQALERKLKRDNDNLYADRKDTLHALISTEIADLNNLAHNQMNKEMNKKIAELKSILEDRMNSVHSAHQTYLAQGDEVNKFFSNTFRGRPSKAERVSQDQINEIVNHYNAEKERIIRETANMSVDLKKEYKRQKEEILQKYMRRATVGVATIGTAVATARLASYLASRRNTTNEEPMSRPQTKQANNTQQTIPNCSEDFYQEKCLELGIKKNPKITEITENNIPDEEIKPIIQNNKKIIQEHFKCKKDNQIKETHSTNELLVFCHVDKTQKFLNSESRRTKVRNFIHSKTKELGDLRVMNDDNQTVKNIVNKSSRQIINNLGTRNTTR